MNPYVEMAARWREEDRALNRQDLRRTLAGAGIGTAMVGVLSVAFVAVNGFTDVSPYVALAGLAVGAICGLGGIAAAHWYMERRAR